MTEKQQQRIKDQIKKIKLTLAAEKRKFGGYDDSRGRRYIPTSLYVKLGDFKGGLRYLKWFNENFPSDIGFPGFLFEATLIYFLNGMIKEAENYALKTFFSNKFLIDQYFGRSNDVPGLTYRHDDDALLPFSAWLNAFMESEKFIQTKKEIEEIEKLLETEPIGPKRSMLVKRLYKLI